MFRVSHKPPSSYPVRRIITKPGHETVLKTALEDLPNAFWLPTAKIRLGHLAWEISHGAGYLSDRGFRGAHRMSAQSGDSRVASQSGHRSLSCAEFGARRFDRRPRGAGGRRRDGDRVGVVVRYSDYAATNE